MEIGSSKFLDLIRLTSGQLIIQLNDYYAHLDSLADMHAQKRNTPRSQSRSSTATKAGHVAPSHRRFKLPLDIRRRGTGPRTLAGTGKGRKRRKVIDDENNVAVEDQDGGHGEDWMWSSGRVGVWPSRLRQGSADEGPNDVVGLALSSS